MEVLRAPTFQPSIRAHVQDDNHQNDGRCKGCRGDDKSCQMLAHESQVLADSMRDRHAARPSAQQCGTAGDEHGERKSQQQHPERPHAPRIPHDYLLSAVSRFVLQRLQAAQDERGHEQGGGGDEDEFQNSDEARSHSNFVIQSTRCCQVLSGRKRDACPGTIYRHCAYLSSWQTATPASVAENSARRSGCMLPAAFSLLSCCCCRQFGTLRSAGCTSFRRGCTSRRSFWGCAGTAGDISLEFPRRACGIT